MAGFFCLLGDGLMVMGDFFTKTDKTLKTIIVGIGSRNCGLPPNARLRSWVTENEVLSVLKVLV